VSSNLATAYLRWTFTRAALARGYWVVTALYLVVIAHLSPFQLIVIGTFQGITVLVAEIPAGVIADAVSRRRTLAFAHAVTGAGMVMAGLVRSFPLLVASQCLWGLGWAIASGADVAWMTDELEAHAVVDRVLVAQARWDLFGNAVGTVVFAAIGWAASLAVAIVASGTAMALLGFVVLRWPETRRAHSPGTPALRSTTAVLRRGIALARADRVVLAIIGATALVNGGSEVLGRLRELRLVQLGLPAHPDPIVWFAALTLVGVALGAIALRAVEVRVHDEPVARRVYVLGCAVGAVGLVCFAFAGNVATGGAGVLLVAGVAAPIVRAVATISVNRRATSDVRATVHSFVSQAEQAGEIVFGFGLALVAQASATVALVAAAVLLGLAGVLVARTATVERHGGFPAGAFSRRRGRGPC
jgi:MFS family permease